jgi:sugar lactone lactonase YvrE
MRGSASRVLAGMVVGTAVAQAAVMIPAERRMPAAVVARLAAPANDPMCMPTDVAVDGAGRAYVADGAKDRILRFTPGGAPDLLPTEIGGQKLDQPIGLTVDSGGQLWIADSGNHRLVVVSGAGTLVEVVELPKSADGSLPTPTDVALSPEAKRLYVVNGRGHQILIRNNATAIWTSLGHRGRSPGQLEWPYMICVDSKGYVAVSEALGARVQRISPSDQWIGQCGRWGIEVGQVYRPRGLATDTRGRVFVSDSELGVVQAFGSDGLIEGVLTDAEGRALHFEHPMGMCFDGGGRLYVVEQGANRVAVVSFGAGAVSRPGSQKASGAGEGSR